MKESENKGKENSKLEACTMSQGDDALLKYVVCLRSVLLSNHFKIAS